MGENHFSRPEAVDLHVHSSCSDGTFSPRELVDYAREKGLAAFALTDHDTVDGLDDAMGYAGGIPDAPEVIPGIELSSEYQGSDIHVVGLYIHHHEERFRRKLQDFIDSRTGRNLKMCALLRQSGVPVTYEALTAAYPGSVITRAHYARYMVEHGFVKSRQEAFDRYVGDHAPCFIPREKITPEQAVQLILQAGGIPVLAHPILYGMGRDSLDTLVRKLKDAGLMGIEAIYSTYTPADERQVRSLAAKYGLLLSGGSDFHGANKPGLDLGVGYGKLFVPKDLFLKIKRSAAAGGISGSRPAGQAPVGV